MALLTLKKWKSLTAVEAVGAAAELALHILLHRNIVCTPLLLENRGVADLTLHLLFMTVVGEDSGPHSGLF